MESKKCAHMFVCVCVCVCIAPVKEIDAKWNDWQLLAT